MVDLPQALRNDGVEIHAYCIVSSNTPVPKRPQQAASESHIVPYHVRLDPEGLHPILTAGRHVWPITYLLPFDAPPSFSMETRVPFRVVHWVRVLIRQKGLLLSADIERLVAVEARPFIHPQYLQQLPVPRTNFSQPMERTLWRSGGTLAVKVDFLTNILVPGTACGVQLTLDMRECKAGLQCAELRLMSRITSREHVDSDWDTKPLARSVATGMSTGIKANGQMHTVILQLPIPTQLELGPSCATPKGSCEYFVMLSISPEAGSRIKRLFKLPLAAQSSLERGHTGHALGSGIAPVPAAAAVYSMGSPAPPSMADMPSINSPMEAPPAYTPPVFPEQ